MPLFAVNFLRRANDTFRVVKECRSAWHGSRRPPEPGPLAHWLRQTTFIIFKHLFPGAIVLLILIFQVGKHGKSSSHSIYSLLTQSDVLEKRELCLTSDESRHITGHDLVINAGVTVRMATLRNGSKR